jgi:hypothetical protein
MHSATAFASGCARFFDRRLMRAPFGVRRLPALAGNPALFLGIHRREAAVLFAHISTSRSHHRRGVRRFVAVSGAASGRRDVAGDIERCARLLGPEPRNTYAR